MSTGERVPTTFVEGWAVTLAGTAHYWRPMNATSAAVRTLCQRASTMPAQLFERGHHEFCRVCVAKRQRDELKRA